MLTSGTLAPAYGRDYTNRKQIIESLNAGHDFMINTFNGSGYCSISDLADGRFQVRNASLRKVWMVTISEGVAK